MARFRLLLVNEFKLFRTAIPIHLVAIFQPTVMYLLMSLILVQPTFDMYVDRPSTEQGWDLVSAMGEVGSPIGLPYINPILIDWDGGAISRQVIVVGDQDGIPTAVQHYGLIDSNLVKNFRNRLTAAALRVWNAELGSGAVTVEEHAWLPRDVPYAVYFGMALLPMTVFMAASIMGAILTAQEFEFGTIVEYTSGPRLGGAGPGGSPDTAGALRPDLCRGPARRPGVGHRLLARLVAAGGADPAARDGYRRLPGRARRVADPQEHPGLSRGPGGIICRLDPGQRLWPGGGIRRVVRGNKPPDSLHARHRTALFTILWREHRPAGGLGALFGADWNRDAGPDRAGLSLACDEAGVTMKRFWILFATELKAWRSDPIAAMGGLIPPTFMLIAFGLLVRRATDLQDRCAGL